MSSTKSSFQPTPGQGFRRYNVLSTIRPETAADEVARAGWAGIADAGEDFVFHGNFGYAVGASFPPTWADGMVFHHPEALRRMGRYGVAVSETSVVTDSGCEVLTTGVERELFVK